MARCGSGLAALTAVLLVASCRRAGPPPPPAIRLGDLYRPAAAAQPVRTPAKAAARSEWRFDGAPPRVEKHAATWGWSAFHGVSGLAVRNGRLVGRATDELPILHLARGPGFEEREAVHGVEVRLRVSAGRTLGAINLSSQARSEKAIGVVAVRQGLEKWAAHHVRCV
jgi:hypothetical protein